MGARRDAIAGTAFASLPLLADTLYKTLFHPRPFWAFYYDPETIYFYDGLRLLRGEAPFNTDNPATFVQLLSAAILAPLPRSPLVIDTFRHIAYAVAFLFSIGAIYLLMRTVLRDSPMLVRLTAIWSVFAFPMVLEYNTVWSPEAFYLAAGGVAVAGAWWYFDAPSLRRSIAFGAAIGFCIALKFTFLVWLVALVASLAFLRAWRHIGPAIGASIAAFVLTTSAAITKYPVMFRLITRMFFHGGAYGEEAQTTVALPAEITASLWRFVTIYWPWHLWFCAVVAVAVASMWRSRRTPGRMAMMLFALPAFLLPYLAASRHITGRYVIPAAIAVVPIIAAWRLPMVMQTILFACVAVLLGVTWRTWLAAHDSRIINAAEMDNAVRGVIDRAKPDAVVAYSWRFPSPGYALRVLAPDDDVLPMIETRFPRVADYEPRQKRLRLPSGARSWDYFVIAPEDFAGSPAATGKPVARVGRYLIVER